MVHVTPDLQVYVVPNPAATNGTFVDDLPLAEPRALGEGEVVQAGASAFVVRAAAGGDTRRRDRLGQVPFNRVPYRRTIVTSRRFEDAGGPARAAEGPQAVAGGGDGARHVGAWAWR